MRRPLLPLGMLHSEKWQRAGANATPTADEESASDCSKAFIIMVGVVKIDLHPEAIDWRPIQDLTSRKCTKYKVSVSAKEKI